MSVSVAALSTSTHSLPRMTEAQFLDWTKSSGKTRAEWVDGKVVVMSAVELAHARIVHFLTLLLGMYAAETDTSEVLAEPYQARFAKLRRRRMPDLMFIGKARAHLLQRMQFEGAPDLIVEVVSPDSQSRDRREKVLEYQKIGVREYWIIDPLVKGVEFFSLKRGKGYVAISVADGQIFSIILPKLFIRPEWFWQLRRPKVSALLKQMGVL